MTDADHQFDRRVGDVNVESLAVQVRALSGRVEVLEEQGRTSSRVLTDNTTLTRETHDAVFGVEGEFAGLANMTRDVHGAFFGTADKPGAIADIKDVRDVLETGRRFFRAIDRTASGAGRLSDGVSKALRRFWWVIAAVAGGITYLKTGKLPDIPLWPQ